MEIEQFSFTPQAYGAELTQNSHQVLYWLNRNGYLDNDAAEHLLAHMIVVPIKNQSKFGKRLLDRFFKRDSGDGAYVFPITLLEEGTVAAGSKNDDEPNLKLVKK